MSPLRRKRRMVDLSGGAAILALTAAAYLSVVEPSVRAQRRLEAERRASAEAQARADEAAKELADTQRQLILLERELDTLAVDLRTPAQINRQIDRLTGIAESAGVRLTRIAPQASWANQWFTAVPISMSGRGTFASAAAFLESVRRECPDVSVRGLKIAGQTGQPAADNAPKGAAASTSIDIEFVWYAEPEGTAGVPTTR